MRSCIKVGDLTTLDQEAHPPHVYAMSDKAQRSPCPALLQAIQRWLANNPSANGSLPASATSPCPKASTSSPQPGSRDAAIRDAADQLPAAPVPIFSSHCQQTAQGHPSWHDSSSSGEETAHIIERKSDDDPNPVVTGVASSEGSSGLSGKQGGGSSGSAAEKPPSAARPARGDGGSIAAQGAAIWRQVVSAAPLSAFSRSSGGDRADPKKAGRSPSRSEQSSSADGRDPRRARQSAAPMSPFGASPAEVQPPRRVQQSAAPLSPFGRRVSPDSKMDEKSSDLQRSAAAQADHEGSQQSSGVPVQGPARSSARSSANGAANGMAPSTASSNSRWRDPDAEDAASRGASSAPSASEGSVAQAGLATGSPSAGDSGQATGRAAAFTRVGEYSVSGLPRRYGRLSVDRDGASPLARPSMPAGSLPAFEHETVARSASQPTEASHPDIRRLFRQDSAFRQQPAASQAAPQADQAASDTSLQPSIGTRPTSARRLLTIDSAHERPKSPVHSLGNIGGRDASPPAAHQALAHDPGAPGSRLHAPAAEGSPEAASDGAAAASVEEQAGDAAQPSRAGSLVRLPAFRPEPQPQGSAGSARATSRAPPLPPWAFKHQSRLQHCRSPGACGLMSLHAVQCPDGPLLSFLTPPIPFLSHHAHSCIWVCRLESACPSLILLLRMPVEYLHEIAFIHLGPA